jgi:septum formation protein
MMNDKKLILASKSPRRKELLTNANIPFTIRTKDTEEAYPADMPLRDVPIYLAQLKAAAMLDELMYDEILLTADTIVLLDEKIYGKPVDLEDAVSILEALSGQTHEVITGVCLKDQEKEIVFSETTKVTFKTLEKEEIIYYLEKYMPYDKAGAYAIQEWIGLVGIRGIEGDYYNIVGLPIHRVAAELKAF